MSTEGPNSKPFNVRLPAWAIDYIDRRALDRGMTKTQVVLDALSGLRARETQELMRQGYEEMSVLNRQMAEDSLAASPGSVTE